MLFTHLRTVFKSVGTTLKRGWSFLTQEVPSTLYDCDGYLSLPRLVLFTTYLLFIAAVLTELCTGRTYENLAVLTAALFGNGTIYLGRQFVTKGSVTPTGTSTPTPAKPTASTKASSPAQGSSLVKSVEEEMDV